ncbi:hypothetical protein FRC98_20205 [Lujinxingia vulgaris]|uniref:Uncharacterized protein n=1 Tax=Lujinxingia vulgaris TaxID=2600176 RepID=A0A5C6X4W8_9DELT|nr:hypothetical protein [Lujinxingia vulgaris]TXD33730.1 hypothetical protein FRC98_20205 [Lujinxingia vulgaris]
MAEPFVFHFQRGPAGEPEVMYMVDLDCACQLCGHVQYQRFYHSTAFHTLSLDLLDELAERAYLKAGYECENCGTEVGPDATRRAALTYGFADDAGVIRVFVDRLEETLRYDLQPRRRLDPQAMPTWHPDAESALVYDELDEDELEEVFGRPFNIKWAWIDLLEDWVEDPEGGAYSRLAPGLWAVVERDEESADQLADEVDEDEFFDALDSGDLAVIPLHDSLPVALATHDHPERIFGRLHTWLPSSLSTAFKKEEVWADAYVSRQAAIETMERTLTTARLTYTLHQTEADVFFSEITTPTGAVYGRGVAISAVLRRAVHTGLTPGEAARLTAEEIVGILLQLW